MRNEETIDARIYSHSQTLRHVIIYRILGCKLKQNRVAPWLVIVFGRRSANYFLGWNHLKG